MAVSDQAFPRLDTQVVDPRTGRITQPWYRFFISVWNRTGGGSGYNIQGILDELDAAYLAEIMGEAADPADLAAAGFPALSASDDGADQPVAGVQAATVAASPTTYSARSPGNLLISGGTVSGVTMTRAGVVTTFPATTSLLPLSPGDMATVTYSVAPTLTFIPR